MCWVNRNIPTRKLSVSIEEARVGAGGVAGDIYNFLFFSIPFFRISGCFVGRNVISPPLYTGLFLLWLILFSAGGWD